MSDITISFKKHLTRMFKMGYDFASHRIASHRIASHRIASQANCALFSIPETEYDNDG